MASSATNTSASEISPVTEARRDSLLSIRGVVKPSAPRSTRKPRITPSSLAHTSATSAIGALVIHILAPFSTNPPWTALATVRIDAGSEPPSASVRPKQPTISPRAMPGRYFIRWASEPKAWIGYITSDDCTLIAER